MREFGYPKCDSDNILTDRIYKQFFISMLEDNRGSSKEIDAAIELLLAKCNTPKEPATPE